MRKQELQDTGRGNDCLNRILNVGDKIMKAFLSGSKGDATISGGTMISEMGNGSPHTIFFLAMSFYCSTKSVLQ